MMGRQTGDQSQLFYLFNLERRIPAGHLLRRINSVVRRVLAELREQLMPFYSDIGRPSLGLCAAVYGEHLRLRPLPPQVEVLPERSTTHSPARCQRGRPRSCAGARGHP